MVSNTQKEIWVREAAARLCGVSERTTIEEDITAIAQGVVFLEDNPDAQKLASKVVDVVPEKVGYGMATYLDKCDAIKESAVYELADFLHIELPDDKTQTNKNTNKKQQKK